MDLGPTFCGPPARKLCAEFHHVFLKFFGIQGLDMGEKRNLLADKSSGDVLVVDGDTVERLVGVEIGYIDWAIKCDGKFENGIWVVARNS
jgi:hypothetical protein